MRKCVGEVTQVVGEVTQVVGEMKQFCWGSDTKIVGEMPQIQSEICPCHPVQSEGLPASTQWPDPRPPGILGSVVACPSCWKVSTRLTKRKN